MSNYSGRDRETHDSQPTFPYDECDAHKSAENEQHEVEGIDGNEEVTLDDDDAHEERCSSCGTWRDNSG